MVSVYEKENIILIYIIGVPEGLFSKWVNRHEGIK